MRDVSILALLFVVVLLCESAWQNVVADQGANDVATTDGLRRHLLAHDRRTQQVSWVSKCVKELESACGSKKCKTFLKSKCLRDVLVDCDYGNMLREPFRRKVRRTYHKKVCSGKGTNSTGGGGGGGGGGKNTTNTTRF
jgi:hypothetical protein